MAKLPPEGRWTQINDSAKFGSISYSKNMKFDERGFAKLSPRSVKLVDGGTSSFGVPAAVGRNGPGTLVINCAIGSGSVFEGSIGVTAVTFTENTGTNDPTMTIDSHGAHYNDLWFATTSQTVVSKSISGGSSATWTDRITGLTAGKRH